MAARLLRFKPESDDMISQLPDDVKDKILECLDTREAARTALLSTVWKDVWLRHGRLVLDWDFNKNKVGREGNKRAVFVKMVSDILFFRSGPVKKFKLAIPESGPKPLQSDLEAWCRYLCRNGIEELEISHTNIDEDAGESRYALPVCIVSCPTIKKLTLDGFDFVCSANVRLGSVFPALNYLEIINCVVYMEEMRFQKIFHIDNFLISGPKLNTLDVLDSSLEKDWKWIESHFRAIKILHIDAGLLLCKHAGVAVPSFPTASNLEELCLYNFRFAEEAFTTFIQLLKECPNLCVLIIVLGDEPRSTYARETAPRMLEDTSGWFKGLYLCKLKTVIIGAFRGSRQEMLFVKAILSKSPALDNLVILEADDIDATTYSKFPRELLSFPRSCPKARVIFDFPEL